MTYNNFEEILVQAKKVCCIDEDCNESNLKIFEKIVHDCVLEILFKYTSFCKFNVFEQTFLIYKSFPLMHFIKADWYIHRGRDQEAGEWLNSAHVIIRKLKRKLCSLWE